MNNRLYFLSQLVRRFRDDDIGSLAAELAYSLLMSSIPFLIFLITILAFLPFDSNNFLSFIEEITPKEAYGVIEKAAFETLNNRNGGLLSFSLLATLWAASRGIKAIIRVLNKAYEEKEKRGFIKTQILSLFFTAGLVIIVFLTVVLLVFGNTIGQYINSFLNLPFYSYLWNVLRYVIIIFTMVFIFSSIYHYMPSRRLSWREVFPGALFCSGGWTVSSLAFSFYVDNFSNYSRLYGSIAGVFILLIWLYFSSMILLIGGEINAMLVKSRI